MQFVTSQVVFEVHIQVVARLRLTYLSYHVRYICKFPHIITKSKMHFCKLFKVVKSNDGRTQGFLSTYVMKLNLLQFSLLLEPEFQDFCAK